MRTAPPLETGDQRTLVQVLRNRCESIGDQPWIVSAERTATYAEVDEKSTRLAHGLRRLGIEPADTVLVLLPNCLDFIYCWCALAKIRAVEVPLNTAGRGGPLQHQINDSCARVIVVAEELLERIEALAGELPTLTHCIVRTSHTSVATIRDRIPALARRCSIILLDELFTDTTTAVPITPSYRDIAAVIYTSGTTGLPKGVMAPHAHAFEYATANATVLDMQACDIHYAALPLFHVAGQWGCAYATALKGATVVLTDRFHAQSFWSEVSRYRATTSFLLGAMASFLYRQPESAADATTTLAKVLMCPLIPEVENFRRRFNLRVSTAYGSTELGGCGVFHMLALPDASSCGRTIDSRCEVRIVDADDEVVPHGSVGEIVVRAREAWTMMQGYWHQPEKTVEAWRNLWFHTGDLGRRDRDGNFYFVDRIKDAIRRRGENISSVEVENEILRHASVLECAVIPIGSPDTEQEIMAVIVPKPGLAISAEELVRFLDTRVAYFMIPRFVEMAAALPKTETGKVQKSVLRERGLSAQTWDLREAGITLSR